jgi:hypothetical protein
MSLPNKLLKKDKCQFMGFYEVYLIIEFTYVNCVDAESLFIDR